MARPPLRLALSRLPQASALPPITIVLVGPKTPENVGAAARAAGNYGAARLAVAAPRFAWDEEQEEEGGGGNGPSPPSTSPLYVPAARRVARGSPASAGGGLLAGALVAPDLETLLSSLGPALTVALTRRAGRARGSGRAWDRPARLASALLASPSPPPSLTLVFGREEHGLTDGEVALCGGGTLALPVPPGSAHGSLNLGAAVAVCLALLHEGAVGAEEDGGALPAAPSLPLLPPDAATAADVAAVVARVSSLAATVGLAPGESSGASHGRRRRSAGIARALLTRAGASRAEVAGVHLLLRACERALEGEGGEEGL